MSVKKSRAFKLLFHVDTLLVKHAACTLLAKQVTTAQRVKQPRTSSREKIVRDSSARVFETTMKPGLCHSRWSARWPRLRFSTRAFATLRPTLCTPYLFLAAFLFPFPLSPFALSSSLAQSFPRGCENMWVFVGIGLW